MDTPPSAGPSGDGSPAGRRASQQRRGGSPRDAGGYDDMSMGGLPRRRTAEPGRMQSFGGGYGPSSGGGYY